MRTQSSDPTHRRPASVRVNARIEFDSTAPIPEVESLLATLPKSDRHRAATAPCLLAPRCIVILTIERKKIPPDIEVLEMNGRIILGNSSRDVELKLAEILSEHAKKIIFDLSGVTILDSTGIGILVVCQGKIHKAGGRLHIAGASGFVEETLKITSVDKLLQLFPSIAEAAAGF